MNLPVRMAFETRAKKVLTAAVLVRRAPPVMTIFRIRERKAWIAVDLVRLVLPAKMGFKMETKQAWIAGEKTACLVKLARMVFKTKARLE